MLFPTPVHFCRELTNKAAESSRAQYSPLSCGAFHLTTSFHCVHSLKTCAECLLCTWPFALESCEAQDTVRVPISQMRKMPQELYSQGHWSANAAFMHFSVSSPHLFCLEKHFLELTHRPDVCLGDGAGQRCFRGGGAEMWRCCFFFFLQHF